MNRMLTTLSLTTALTMLATASSFAQSAMHNSMSHGSMHGSMAMPHCASSDPAVMVNSKDKTYSMATKSQMMMMHHNGMNNNNHMMMANHMSMMCKSKADAMGAHMMKGSMNGNMQHH